MVVGRRLRRRRRAARVIAERDEQLADAVRAIASALRAGMSVPQAIGFAARESVPPLRATWSAMDAALELGVPFDDALDRWVFDVGTDDARLVAGVLAAQSSERGRPPDHARPGREHATGASCRNARGAGAHRASPTVRNHLGVLPVGFFAFLWITSRNEIEGAFRSPAGGRRHRSRFGARRPGLPVDPSSAGGSMNVLAVAAAAAAAVLLVASARALLVGGLRHRLPSMPVPSAERDRKKRPLPRWIWIAGGCLVVLPVVALPFPAPLLVLVPCLVGYRLRHLAAQRRDRRRSRDRRRDPATARSPGSGIVCRACRLRSRFRAPLSVLRGPLGPRVAGDASMPWNSARGGGRNSQAMTERLALPDLRRAVPCSPGRRRSGPRSRSATRELAADVRRSRRAAVTERARAAPVKMLFPLVFLVLPAFLLLTVVPVLLTTVQSIR